MKQSACDRRPPHYNSTAMRSALLDWYEINKRDLPWRQTRDPYRVWVSEVMLQQTTVGTVIPYYERFLTAFPTTAALAEAPEEEVLRLWSGLGYYHRARNLHKAARAVHANGGVMPRNALSLAGLPGIGKYTAAAIASIAFDEPVAVVDGNVVRVLTRVFGLTGDPKRTPINHEIAARAAGLVDHARPGDSNQALMELGATVCTPRAPRCPACPWSQACVARTEGHPERYPESQARRETIPVLRAAALVADGEGRVLLTKIPDGEPNQGLWEFPSAEVERGERVPVPLRWSAALKSRGEAALVIARALHLRLGEAVSTVRHAITHHRIAVTLFHATIKGRAPARASNVWVTRDAVSQAPLTSAARKLARHLLEP